jgi:hypothetical protein
MRNNITCQVVRIGTMRINMHNDVVRTLIDGIVQVATQNFGLLHTRFKELRILVVC